MTATPDAPTFEDLLGHAAWVRALARGLVADPALAEDAVQDTWLAALERPPATGDNPRGWLATVLRNALRMRARGSGRRADREAFATVGEEDRAPLGSDELFQRVETHRRLSEAVLALDEPARSTVILRYYEGLSAAEIARRTDAPEGTVRWRLAKAREELRGRLDDDFGGDRAAWIALLLPLAKGGAPAVGASAATAGAGAGLLQGILAMNLVFKLSLSAGVAAIGLFVSYVLFPELLGLEGREGPPPVEVSFRPIDAVEPEAVDGEVAAAKPAPVGERVVVPAASVQPEAETAATPQVESGVRLRVIDGTGAPVPGTLVHHEHDRDARAVTDADGVCVLRLPIDGAPQNGDPEAVVLCDRPGFLVARAAARLRPDALVELGDVTLEPAGDVAVVVLDADGAPVEGAWVDWERVAYNEGYGVYERTDETIDHRRAGGDTDARGRFRLERLPTGEVHVWAGVPGDPSAPGAPLATRSGSVRVRGGMISEGVELRLGVVDPAYLIAGRVLDPAGDAEPRAELRYDYKRFGGSGSGSKNTDQEGRFFLPVKPGTTWNIGAVDRAGRYLSTREEGVEGGANLVLRLANAERLALTVRLGGAAVADLRDVPGLTVWASSPDRKRTLVRDTQVAFERNAVSVPIPREAFLLFVSADGYEERTLGPFDGAAAPRELTVDLGSLPGVRGVVTAGGEPVAGGEVALFAEVTGRTVTDGFPVRVGYRALDSGASGADGGFELTLREAGRFYLRAEANGYAPSELGPFEYDPARGLNGLSVELGQGGELEGVVYPRRPGRIVGISRGDAQPRSARTDANGAYRFEGLVPGRYAVKLLEEELSDRSRTTRTQSGGFRESDIPFDCVVEAGATTRFDLTTDDREPAVIQGSLLVDGTGPEGFVAALLISAPLDARIADTVGQAAVGADGSFRLEAPEAGSYRLTISDRSTLGTVYLTTIDVGPGLNPWSASFETGTLEVTGASKPHLGLIPQELFRAQSGDILILAGLSPPKGTEEGAPFTVRVPAVRGEVVRLDVEELTTGEDPEETGEVVERVSIPPGGSASVVIDG